MDLTALFCPKSVAIIGASKTPTKVGAIVLKNIIESGFEGAIYPINPGEVKIGDLTCYKDLKSLPSLPDLAIIAVPTQPALDILIQIGEAGIKNVVIYTAGFREVGADGEKLEKQLLETSKKYKLNLLGPNCFGYVNNLCPINVTFGNPSTNPGNLRFISQSGALAASLFDWCASQGIGFSDFVTLGNKTVISENDVLDYFRRQMAEGGGRMAEDRRRKTEVGRSTLNPIGLYLESISDGQEFLRIAKEITKTDPVFVLKPGKTAAAASAMKSHTGSIAGADYILEEALKEAGVIRANTLEDFFDLTRAFAWENAPEGPRVAIVSNAGGPSVICADAASEEGLILPEFDPITRLNLLEVLPRTASIANPVDVLGDALADRFAKATEIILQTKMVDSVVVILTPQVMTQIEQTAEALGELSKKYQKPIFCSFIGGHLVAEGEQILNKYQIPSFRFPERAIMAIGAMWRFKKQITNNKEQITSLVGQSVSLSASITQAQKIVEKAAQNGHKTLDNLEANNVLSLGGVQTPPTAFVKTLEDAIKFSSENGWPVVLKLSSPGLLHKKKVGGVIVGIKNEEQLDQAWDTLQRKITHLDQEIQKNVGIQIQKEVPSGVEVIVGIKRDPNFGPVLLFGAGGSLAELVADRNLRLLPVDTTSARTLVEGSKVYSLLKAKEGEPAYALEKLYELLVNLGKLAELLPDVSDIEINPVIVTQNAVWAVDGKVILENRPIVGPRFQTATCVSSEVLAAKYHYFEFEVSSPLKFEPGQYVSVKVSSDRINCYSIAGSTSQNKFNLLVDTTPGGPGSKFFESLQAGGKLSFLGPFGTFTLKPSDGVKQLLFLGTGSGLAPLKCQIESLLRDQNCKLPLTLYLGLSETRDVFFKDYFEKLAAEFPNFRYNLVVWKPDEQWKGLTGFITEYVKRDFKNARDCAAYLCGNKKMIEDVSSLLESRGCPKERIYTEKY